MCIKIIRTQESQEFNPFEPLEYQVTDAKEVVVNYDPQDPTVDNIGLFVDQMERLCRNGISCNVDIKVNANNHLDGIKIERRIDNLKRKLDINEVVKGLTTYQAIADRKMAKILELIHQEKISE